ncbi:CBS domain-containing protein [Aliiglaciecola sp. CAU 1673]|uniref:CBS domain-containing protein n=1 Tax=Aliiglaciecola sp. CAU 1673 TaxID=3032595 RepID=UPI0023DBA438|nr:CBS domain-containing protein [Aliiglaciecola sp. CAU 1673]MDF2176954.1 CBS domain-containing protein [Aliiglaciecola sp. CAU 1673]
MLVKDIMTTKLHTLTNQATLQDAHKMSREFGIRHIPVLDAKSGKFVGVVTQKALVSRVMKLANLYGQSELDEQEKRVPIMEVAVVDCDKRSEDQPLLEVAEYFLSHKHGCLPVVDKEDKLKGIITSSDFVKLSIKLLSQS